MLATIFILLAASPAEWGDAPRYRLLQLARLVVAGEVIALEPDAKAGTIARLRVDLVLKGKPESQVISLPFKDVPAGACDFSIRYEKGKRYLLLIDDKFPFRIVWYPSGTHDPIPSLDDPDVEFVRLILAVMNGEDLEKGIPDLLKRANDPRPGADRSRRESLQVFRALPRAWVRPFLSEIRASAGSPPWRKLTPASPDWHYYCCTFLSAELEIVRDLSYVSSLLEKVEFIGHSLPDTLRLLVGKEVGDLATFKSSWEIALRRAAAHGSPDDVKPLVEHLGRAEPEIREKAFQAILDLGPDVIDSVRSHKNAADPEVRARVLSLLTELELLSDLRADIAARRN